MQSEHQGRRDDRAPQDRSDFQSVRQGDQDGVASRRYGARDYERSFVKIAIVKYNAGNTASVVNALGRIGVETVVTDDPQTLTVADKVIFPGVGEASSAMSHLRERRLTEI